MTTFATDSLFIICFNTLKHCFTVDLVAALGGIPGAFFLLLYPYQYPIFFTTKSIKR